MSANSFLCLFIMFFSKNLKIEYKKLNIKIKYKLQYKLITIVEGKKKYK